MTASLARPRTVGQRRTCHLSILALTSGILPSGGPGPHSVNRVDSASRVLAGQAARDASRCSRVRQVVAHRADLNLDA
jgi:hypothetical protein